MPISRIWACLALSLGLLGAAVPMALAAPTRLDEEPSEPSDLVVASVSPEVVARARAIELVNQERAQQNLPSLVENPILDAAAQSYAEILTSDACFGHNCGAEPDFRARDAGAGYLPWLWLGENVAAGQDTPEEAIGAWMNSQLHRENILRPQFTEVGVGIGHGGLHRTYWAAEFGTRPDDGD